MVMSHTECDDLRPAIKQVKHVPRGDRRSVPHIFDQTFIIELDRDNLKAPKLLAKWITNTFAFNFILLEYSDRRIAGGHGSKEFNPFPRTHAARERRPTGTYELRCSNADATLFLLKFKNWKDQI